MSEKIDTLRTSMYLSDRQDPRLLKIMREIDPYKRSQWLRDACNFYLDSQETPDPEAPAPDSPLDSLLSDLEEKKDEL